MDTIRGSGKMELPVSAAAGEDHAAHDCAFDRGVIRLLGSVHMAPGLPFRAGFKRRRGARHSPHKHVDHLHADRHVLWYLVFGWLADHVGRRPAFAFYVVAAAMLTPFYGSIPRWAGSSAGTWLLVIGPLIGFFGTGYFSLFGAMLAELYPTPVRGAGQGFAYNFGRGLSALAPFAVGAIADRSGLGLALGLNSAFFLIGGLLVYLLPETKNAELAASLS